MLNVECFKQKLEEYEKELFKYDETFHDGYLHSGGHGNDDGFAGGLQQ